MTCLVLQNRWTALMMAARYGHAGIAEMLVSCGADMNAKNKVSVGSSCLVLGCHNLLLLMICHCKDQHCAALHAACVCVCIRLAGVFCA